MNRLALVLTILVALSVPAWSQSGSYLDAVYQVYDNASDTDPLETLKNDIRDQFEIEIADDPDVHRWTEDWLNATKAALTALPANFRAATRMIYLEPSNLDFEVKYNGFNDQHGIVQMGHGSMYPSSVYVSKFKATYNRLPTSAEKIARFKYILARGMAYSFIQENPDIFKAYGQTITYGDYPTKVYGPGAEANMVVLPGKTLLMIDLAFAIGEYCAAPASLQKKSQDRFDFVKAHVMGGTAISGWDYKPVDDSASNTTDPGNDDPGNNVEVPTASGAPEIPDGDYMPIVTEVDVGTAAVSLTDNERACATNLAAITDAVEKYNIDHNTMMDSLNISQLVTDRYLQSLPSCPEGGTYSSQGSLVTNSGKIVCSVHGTLDQLQDTSKAPDMLKSAIVELFEVLPKFFSTCTQAIAYMPTTDTETAFSAEGFVFITQNSWFMPSFVELNDAARGKRFKEILMREMTLRFLYFHPEVTQKWKDTFDKTQSSYDAYIDMQQAVVGYFAAPAWLKQLNQARYNFIKTEFMQGKEF